MLSFGNIEKSHWLHYIKGIIIPSFYFLSIFSIWKGYQLAQKFITSQTSPLINDVERCPTYSFQVIFELVPVSTPFAPFIFIWIYVIRLFRRNILLINLLSRIKTFRKFTSFFAVSFRKAASRLLLLITLLILFLHCNRLFHGLLFLLRLIVRMWRVPDPMGEFVVDLVGIGFI